MATSQEPIDVFRTWRNFNAFLETLARLTFLLSLSAKENFQYDYTWFFWMTHTHTHGHVRKFSGILKEGRLILLPGKRVTDFLIFPFSVIFISSRTGGRKTAVRAWNPRQI